MPARAMLEDFLLELTFEYAPRYHLTFTSDETLASRYNISAVKSRVGVSV